MPIWRKKWLAHAASPVTALSWEQWIRSNFTWKFLSFFDEDPATHMTVCVDQSGNGNDGDYWGPGDPFVENTPIGTVPCAWDVSNGIRMTAVNSYLRWNVAGQGHYPSAGPNYYCFAIYQLNQVGLPHGLWRLDVTPGSIRKISTQADGTWETYSGGANVPGSRKLQNNTPIMLGWALDDTAQTMTIYEYGLKIESVACNGQPTLGLNAGGINGPTDERNSTYWCYAHLEDPGTLTDAEFYEIWLRASDCPHYYWDRIRQRNLAPLVKAHHPCWEVDADQLVDTSGNSLHINAPNAAVGQPGPYPVGFMGAIYVEDTWHVETPTPNINLNNSSLTVALSFKLSAGLPDGQMFNLAWDANDGVIVLANNGGEVGIHAAENMNQLIAMTTGVTFDDGQWHTICCRWDRAPTGGRVDVWVDGVWRTSNSGGLTPTAFFNSTGENIEWGRGQGGFAQFDGELCGLTAIPYALHDDDCLALSGGTALATDHFWKSIIVENGFNDANLIQYLPLWESDPNSVLIQDLSDGRREAAPEGGVVTFGAPSLSQYHRQSASFGVTARLLSSLPIDLLIDTAFTVAGYNTVTGADWTFLLVGGVASNHVKLEMVAGDIVLEAYDGLTTVNGTYAIGAVSKFAWTVKRDGVWFHAFIDGVLRISIDTTGVIFGSNTDWRIGGPAEAHHRGVWDIARSDADCQLLSTPL